MLKNLSDLFFAIGIHPVLGGFLLGVGVWFLFAMLKRAITFTGGSASDELARFRDPGAFPSGHAPPRAVDRTATRPISGAAPAFPFVSAEAGPSDEVMREVLAALRSKNKIEAVKIYKQATGLGLAESKYAVERFQAEQGL